MTENGRAHKEKRNYKFMEDKLKQELTKLTEEVGAKAAEIAVKHFIDSWKDFIGTGRELLPKERNRLIADINEFDSAFDNLCRAHSQDAARSVGHDEKLDRLLH